MKNILSLIVFMFCFSLVSAQWEQIGAQVNGDEEDNRFGVSTAMNQTRDRMVVGSQSTVAGTVDYVKVFEYNGSNWE